MSRGLAQELDALETMSRQELLGRWLEIHGRQAPVRIGRGLLIRALSYELQAKHHGGLSAANKRELLC